METYIERIENRADKAKVSIELIREMETAIAQGHKESIHGFKLRLEELIDRVWHLELRAKKIGNWSECEYYYRLSCQLRELCQELG
ncbi:hypothetical protein [Myxosarcina sp. GI1]|uniref:hypothetical protein n=1 Tax=Myxosarcina sp. GI1 TaxID=1541065 RepID=UPI0005660C29|nr:hypothetical protein [Myxosarcina sp. GI1]